MDPILDAPPADDTTPEMDQPVTDQVTAPEPTQVAPQGFREQCADAMGWDTTDFADDDAFKAALSGSLEQLEGDRELVNLGRQFAPVASQWPAFQEWQQEQQAAQASAETATAEPAAAEVPAFEWDYPEPNDNDLAFLERDPATGLYRPKGDWIVPPGTAERVNQQVAGQRTMAERLVTQFPSLVTGVTAPIIEGLRTELSELKAAFTTAQERLDSQTYMQQHAGDFYQHDEQGNLVVDPQTHQPVLSPVGRAQQDAESALRDAGMTDPDQLRSVAEAFVSLQREAGRFESPNGKAAQPAANPSSQAVQTGEAKRQFFIDRVTTNQHAPDRGGTIPDATAPDGATQNAGADIDACFQEAAREAGVDLRRLA